MAMVKDKSTILYGILLVVVLAGVYFFFFAGGEEVPGITTTAQDPTSEISRDLLNTLTSLNVIQLDDTLFSDPVFVALSDFGVIIPTQPIGRRNPFEPL